MTQLNLFNGRALRDQGMKLAQEHAEDKSPGWTELALGYVREYCCYHSTFTGEDVRLYAEKRGFTIPPHKRAWGAVMANAAKVGIVKKIGTKQVSNPRAHCAIATLWARA